MQNCWELHRAEVCCASIASPRALMALPSAWRGRNTIRIAIDSKPFSNVAPRLEGRERRSLRCAAKTEGPRRPRAAVSAVNTAALLIAAFCASARGLAAGPRVGDSAGKYL